MSYHNSLSTNYLSRTTNLPSITNWTIMGWFKLFADRNTYSCIFSFGTNSSGAYYALETDSSGTDLYLFNSATFNTISAALVVGEWNHYAVTCSGTGAGNLICYKNGVNQGAHSGSGTPTAAIMYCGTTPVDNDWANGSFENVMVFDVALSADEVHRQARSSRPISRCNSWSKIRDSRDVMDLTGQGNYWTIGGNTNNDDIKVKWPPPRRLHPAWLRAAAAPGGGSIPIFYHHYLEQGIL